MKLSEIKDELFKKLTDNIRTGADGCDWSEVSGDDKRLYIQIGAIDRGPRTDHGGGDDGDDWMDDCQLDDLREEYTKKNQRSIDRVKEIVKEMTGIEAKVSIDYGEKGHCMLDIEVTA